MGVRESGHASLSHLRGRPALTPFRAQRLHDSLLRELPGFSAISADYLYFVALREPLGVDDRSLLARLLDARPAAAEIIEEHGFLVVPRPGTISPWSSKASDILHNCGLRAVERVERGVQWNVRMHPGVGDGARVQEVLAPRVHDRMTQAVVA